MCVCAYTCVCVCVCACIYIYKKLNHFAVHPKLTQYCKSTILQFSKKTPQNCRVIITYLLFSSEKKMYNVRVVLSFI